MEEKEIWKDIKGYEGLYQVSNLGRVKRLSGLVRNRYGNGTAKHKGRILKDYINTQGYHCIKLYRDGKRKYFSVHRLVYMAFKCDIPEGMQVNHISEDKNNNALNNLNLMTPKENANYGTRNERTRKKLGKKVIMDEDNEFDSIKEAAKFLGCAATNVSKCCRNITHTACGHTFRYK